MRCTVAILNQLPGLYPRKHRVSSPPYIWVHGSLHTVPLVTTFNDVQAGELLCYWGSNATLEVAVNKGSAQAQLNCRVGDHVGIRKIACPPSA